MHIDFPDPLALCQREKPVYMRIMAVYASVGHEPVHMERAVMLLHVLTGRKKRLILKEISVLDRLCDLRKILIYDAPCAHIEMPYFRVPHLAVRQPYRQPAGVPLHERARRHQLIHDRSPAFCHRIAILLIV